MGSKLFVALALLSIAGGFSAGGCFVDECADVQCEPCAPPLTLFIRERAGAPLTGGLSVMVNKVGGTIFPVDLSCQLSDGLLHCSMHPGEQSAEDVSGTYRVDITAASYLAQSFDVNVFLDRSGGCCSCGYQAAQVDVEMVAQN